MLAEIVIPIADFRPFAAGAYGRLSRPVWPSPRVKDEFVRAIGGVERRRRGGLSGWLGEGEVCDASAAIRFGQLSRWGATDQTRYRRIVAFRRYFSDGDVLHKFDVGFSIRPQSGVLTRRQTVSLIGSLLATPTHSPGFGEAPFSLHRAGQFLKRRLIHATTTAAEISSIADATHHLYEGTPAFYLEINRDREEVEPPRYAKAFATPEGDEVIRHWFDDATDVPVFALFHSHRVNDDRVRSLRLLVTRLWAEAECLSAFTAHANSQYFQAAPRSPESQRIQHYLKAATRHLRRMRRQTFEDEYGSLYAEAMDGLRHLRPGRVEGLLETLRQLDVRRNLFHDVESTVGDAMAEVDRPYVFISYSHRDAEVLQRLQAHLRPLERDGRIESWADTRIQPGDEWREEIAHAIEKASVAVLLISADFFASDFISRDELPPLLESAERKGTKVLCLILSPSRFQREPALSRYQTVNPPDKPLSAMERSAQESVFDRVAQTIEDLLGGGPRG